MTYAPLAAAAPQRATDLADERDFQELERSAPQSAGFYFDSTGALVVQLASPEGERAARMAIARLVASGRVRFDDKRDPLVRVRNAKFSYAQLAA